MNVTLLNSTPDAEKHIEFCARQCYDSQDKMSDESTKKMIEMILKRGHLSVTEHSVASFQIEGVSRSLSLQLVRHRLANFSQRSQRYVKETDFDYIIPENIKNNEWARIRFENLMKIISETYNEFITQGIKAEDSRAVLPNACSTDLVMTANFREWLHVIDERVSPQAQDEIRELCITIWKKLYEIAPTVFSLTYFEHCGKVFEYKKEIFENRIK